MENAKPIPGVDYPRTFDEMEDWFLTEVQCRDYIRRLCWPNGFSFASVAGLQGSLG